jgi:F-type H+-transporting ATPase subunit delta
MKVPKQARRQAKALFRSCLVNGSLEASKARQVVDQVLAIRPRGYLPMLAHFQRLVKLDMDRRAARIESVAPLPPPLRSTIQSGLERRYGTGLDYTFAQSPHLLGGIRIKVGSDVYDGSVRGRLDDLKDAFESA